MQKYINILRIHSFSARKCCFYLFSIDFTKGFDVIAFASGVASEIKNAFMCLVGKKSFWAGRSGQLDSGQMCFSIHLSLFSIYYIL